MSADESSPERAVSAEEPEAPASIPPVTAAAGPPKRRTGPWLVAGALLAFVLILVLIFALNSRSPVTEPQNIPVVTAPLESNSPPPAAVPSTAPPGAAVPGQGSSGSGTSNGTAGQPGAAGAPGVLATEPGSVPATL